jgi:WXG100 family type VII secretion target
MAGGYEGTVQQFTDANAKVVGVKEQIEGDLKSLYGQLTELESAWRGTAKSAFDQLMVRFTEDEKKLNQALQGIAEQLRAAGSQYEESESSQQDSFSNISNTLG